MNKNKNALKWLVIHFPELIAGITLTIAVFTAGLTAISRYAFRYTYGGADEIQCICFAWTVFLGSAAVYRNKGHFGIDLVVAFFGEKMQGVLKVIAQALIMTTMIVLTVLSWKLTISVGGKIWSFLGVSYVISDLPLVIGFALMSIYAAIFLVQDVKALGHPKNSVKEEE